MKRILTALLLFIFPLVNRAQWKVGINGGASLNRYTVQQPYELWFDKYSWGTAIGVYGQYNITKYIGVRTEVNLTQKNNRFRLFNDITHYKTTNIYLHLPVMATNTIHLGKWMFIFNYGIYGAYWLSSSASSDYDISDFKGINNEYDNRVDFGLVGGIEAGLQLSNNLELLFETRCYYSTLSTKKKVKGIKYPEYNTTFVFMPSICYTF